MLNKQKKKFTEFIEHCNEFIRPLTNLRHRNKEKASCAVFFIWIEKLIPHTTCFLYMHRHTRVHRKTQLIRSRHIGHLGHFLLPSSLWERSRSQILIPLVWSRRSAQFWKMAKSEPPKVNHSRWEVTEHEVRTTNMPSICERSVCAFQQGWISQLFTFFPGFLRPTDPVTERRIFSILQICFLDSSRCLSLPRAHPTQCWKWRK